MKSTIKTTLTFAALLFSVTFVAGCGDETVRIRRGEVAPETTGINSRDCQQAASEAVSTMLRTGCLNRQNGKRYVVVISKVLNDTMQRIDTDQVVKKIRIDLLNSGKAAVTTAISGNGPEDKMNYDVKDLAESRHFKKSTVVKKGQMIAPELSLSGKFIQKNNRINSSRQLVEYYFQMTLTDLKTGLAIWEGETVIRKNASNKSVSW